MNEDEVRSILIEQLTGHDTSNGIANAYYQISLRILERLAKEWAEQTNWELL